MNLKIIKGRLTRDPEYTRKEEENRSFAKFTVATDRRFGDEADFHDCIVFGKRAAVIDKWFSKGSEILCWGEEQHESYTGKDGVKRKQVTLVVADFEFCGSKNSSGSNPKPSKAETSLEAWQEQESDIPF